MARLTNVAKDRLAAGQLSLGVGIRISSHPAVARAMAAAGFDWLFIDLEHGNLGIESASHLSAAALGAGIAPLVRVPPRQNWMASRVLEGGAMGVVMPDVRNAGEAQNLVEVTKFRPLGRRNIGGPAMQLAYNVLPPQETADFYNQTTLSVAMVETREAVEAVDEITAVEGLDVVMIGGNDLTTSMEIPGQTDNPRVIEAFEALTAACKKHDKFAGMGGVNNDEHAKRYVDMGVRFILGGADTGFLASGAATRTAALRQLSE